MTPSQTYAALQARVPHPATADGGGVYNVPMKISALEHGRIISPPFLVCLPRRDFWRGENGGHCTRSETEW